MAVLGLRFCARAPSSCGKWGPLFIAVRGPLTIATSLVAEHRLQTRRLSNCAHGPSRSAAWGILPGQGSNPCPLHWQADSQPLRHQGSPHWHFWGNSFFKNHGLKYYNKFANKVSKLSHGKNKRPNFWSKNFWEGFPGGTVIGNPPTNAGDVGSSPGPGRSHMPQSSCAHAPQLLSLRSGACEPQLLSPRATTTEACVPRACAPQQEKPPQREARAPQRRAVPACCN